MWKSDAECLVITAILLCTAAILWAWECYPQIIRWLLSLTAGGQP
jgi:hypothetical protein